MSQTGLSIPIFVLGSPRSGTTLLAGIINQLSGVHITRETGFVADLYEPDMPWLNRRSEQLDRLIDQTWSYLVRQGWKTRPTVDDFHAFASTHDCCDYSTFVRYCWQLETAANAQQPKYLGDNTPRYTLAVPLLHRLFPNAMYVHLVRDGRDVVCSLMERHFGANSLLCAARSWMDHIGSWQMAERIIPTEQRIELRYEDLVADTATASNRIQKFLGVEVAPGDHSLDAHGLSQQMDHHRRLSSPIDSSSIGRFRSQLSEKQVADIEAIMYAGLVAYDYDVGPYRPSAVMLDQSLLLTGSHVMDLVKRAVRKVQPCP